MTDQFEAAPINRDAPAPPGSVGQGMSDRRLQRSSWRRCGVAALLVAILAGIAFLAAGATGGSSPASPSAPGAPIDGYPQRIGFDRPSPPLPDRPGPLAATLYDNDFGNGRQLGVTSRGRLWEIPRGTNVLSPDGRLLLTGQWHGRLSRLMVHDLSTGNRRVFDDIAHSLERPDPPRSIRYFLDSSRRIHWSPDHAAVLASFAERGHRAGPSPRVLDVVSGALTKVRGGDPAGFRSPLEAVTVRKMGGPNAEGGILATTTDLLTGETSHLPLRLTGPWRGDPDATLVASVSPDGSTLLLLASEGQSPDATLRMFSMTDGAELTPRTAHHWDGCTPTWLGEDPVVPTKRGVAGSELISADGSRPLVAVHHRLQSSCLRLTADALRAGPHRALFGTWTYLWTWYWWQLLLAGSLTLCVPALLIWRHRRNRST